MASLEDGKHTTLRVMLSDRGFCRNFQSPKGNPAEADKNSDIM